MKTALLFVIGRRIVESCKIPTNPQEFHGRLSGLAETGSREYSAEAVYVDGDGQKE